ncbi:MAG: diguanylate cyclase, partial [Lachnospiraceae bacterium]|nr:diguanylate cyclase [Lachnospiraceae bacterium]
NREELVQLLRDKMDEQAAKKDVDEWLKPTAAIGLALFDSKIDKDCDTVFKRADEAMYENKKKMKACRKD